MNDLTVYGGGQVFAWTKDYLLKLLSTGENPVLTDPLLINAFRAIDRADFVGDNNKHLAYQDKLIDLGYGEQMTNPVTVAQQVQIFSPRYGGSYLHIGAGTGYVSAILAFVAGEAGKVFALERIQWLWEQARGAIQNYPELKNLEILYRDGAEGLSDQAPYDGILYSFAVEDIPEVVKQQLVVGGKIVVPTKEHMLRVIERISDDEYMEEFVPGFGHYNFGVQKEGRA